MLTHPAHPGRPDLRSVGLAVACLSAMLIALACDKVPLLAPTGSVITIFPAATTVPANGEIEIVATVIEQGTTQTPPATGNGQPGQNGQTGQPTTTSTTGAGTPVQNGTLVTFTTTLGRIEPSEARTQGGQVRVRFLAGSQSGTATITAFSGGASGRIENLRVGSAATERVVLTATPQALGCTGGTAQLSARVEDTSGAGLPGIPVAFTTTTGQVNPPTANTDSEGVARTQLTTSREADVTATVAGKTATVKVTLNPRTGVSIAAPTTSIAAGVVASFTVNVSSTANVNNVSLNLGDGTVRNLGPISGSTVVPHTYQEAGTYTVTATASDAGGCSEQVSTAVTVLPAQPPSVIVTASNNTPTVGEVVQLTATVSGNTSTIIRYEWAFGAGADRPTAVTTGNRTSVSWATPGTKVITVTVFQASGPSGDGQTAVTVRQALQQP